jgi:hypothetical protein
MFSPDKRSKKAPAFVPTLCRLMKPGFCAACFRLRPAAAPVLIRPRHGYGN